MDGCLGRKGWEKVILSYHYRGRFKRRRVEAEMVEEDGLSLDRSEV